MSIIWRWLDNDPVFCRFLFLYNLKPVKLQQLTVGWQLFDLDAMLLPISLQNVVGFFRLTSEQFQSFREFVDFIDLLMVSSLELNASPLSKFYASICPTATILVKGIQGKCTLRKQFTDPWLLNGSLLCTKVFHYHLSTSFIVLPLLRSKFLFPCATLSMRFYFDSTSLLNLSSVSTLPVKTF